MVDRVFVCPKCRALCISEDWNERKSRCKYCSGNKYHAQVVEVDGYKFDSMKEAARWRELRVLEVAGVLSRLERQVPYKLVVNDLLICKYIADFRYVQANGQVVVEDVKSQATRTATYRLKKKLMQALYNIEITEVL